MKFSETYCRAVWLIDDEETALFVTTHVLKINKFASQVRSFTNALEALAELNASAELKKFPDFIFLDLFMPVIGGLEFLQAYSKFKYEVRKECTLYILSSSSIEDEIKQSLTYEDVRDFFSKPLNRMDLEVVKFQKEKRGVPFD